MNSIKVQFEISTFTAGYVLSLDSVSLNDTNKQLVINHKKVFDENKQPILSCLEKYSKVRDETGKILTIPAPITGAFAGFSAIIEIGYIHNNEIIITKTKEDIQKIMKNKLYAACAPFPVLIEKINAFMKTLHYPDITHDFVNKYVIKNITTNIPVIWLCEHNHYLLT